MERRDEYREAVRTGLARGLAAAAKGLSSASRALASAAQQLRPPQAAGPPGARPGPAGGGPAAAPDATNRGSGGSATTGTTGAGSVTVRPAAGRRDVEALASRTVKEITAELDELTTEELRALYEVEVNGRARKTLVTAIDKALASR